MEEKLVREFIAAYVDVQALEGKICSARAELDRRARAMCEEIADAARNTPVLVDTPLGFAVIAIAEEWFLERRTSVAVQVRFLQTLADIDREKLSQAMAREEAERAFPSTPKQKAIDS